jgi:hypothetical protein
LLDSYVDVDRKIKLSSEQLCQADNLDPRRACQQLVEGLLAQRAQALDELPRFLKRLSFSDVAEELEELDSRTTQAIQGIRAANLAAHRISFVLALYEDGQTSAMSSGDLMCPASMSGRNNQSRRSASVGRYCVQSTGYP